MDDAGAVVALSALGHFRYRQRSARKAVRRTMVSAVALRALARGQRSVEFSCSCCALLLRCFQTKPALLLRVEPGIPNSH
jgi:hypothetical protein